MFSKNRSMQKRKVRYIHFHVVVNMVVVLLVGLVLRLFPAFAMGNYIIKSTTASECITSLSRMYIGRNIRLYYYWMIGKIFMDRLLLVRLQ